MNPRPRVLLADDHAMLLEAFRKLLSPHAEIVGAVSDGWALVESAPRLMPDVIVLDISMPRLNGLDACRRLQSELPKTKWIFLTVNEDPDMAAEALRAGASAYLTKSSAASELFEALTTAMRGGRYVTPLISKGAPLSVFLQGDARDRSRELTSRQRQVLQLLAEGHVMKEVASILNVTPRTVAFHKYTIMKQIGARSSAELVQHAVKLGLVGGGGAAATAPAVHGDRDGV